MSAEPFAGLHPWQREALAGLGKRAQQHRRLFVFLCLHGATACRRLEVDCKVRSVTNRMAELRRHGLVESARGLDVDGDGEPRRTAIYSLRAPSPQLDLFPPA